MNTAPLSLSRASTSARLQAGLLAATVLATATPAARAQVTFSIDRRGPTIGAPNPFTPLPTSAGDILTPATAGLGIAGSPALGPLPPPGVLFPAGVTGLGLATAGACLGAPPGAMCPIEVDALSYGTDFAPPAGMAMPAGTYLFSVDEFAAGIGGSPMAPAVWSEMPVGDHSADVFAGLAMPPGPLAPGAIFGNTGRADGNGLVSGSGAVYPGFGVAEPRFAAPFVGPALGDNVDAIDFETPAGVPFGIFFSLEGGFPDPRTGAPRTASAGANGFQPGQILHVTPGGAPAVWATTAMLGLDFAGPIGSDDLDALAIRENGVSGFQSGPQGDFVLFSLRIGSATIGMPDSLFGAPIEPGDILRPSGIAGVRPSIWIPAEALGLRTTRAGMGPFGDELDALDVVAVVPTIESFCAGDGSAGVCPCGNFGMPGHGCKNSISSSALLTATGTTAPDTLVLTSTGELATSVSVFLQGTSSIAPGVVFGDGLRCVAGTLTRLYVHGAVGGVVSAPLATDPAIRIRSAALGDPIALGSTRTYQVYYRDPHPTFCTPDTFNSSNALRVIW